MAKKRKIKWNEIFDFYLVNKYVSDGPEKLAVSFNCSVEEVIFRYSQLKDVLQNYNTSKPGVVAMTGERSLQDDKLEKKEEVLNEKYRNCIYHIKK